MADPIQRFDGITRPASGPLREAVVVQLLLDDVFGRRNRRIHPPPLPPGWVYTLAGSLADAAASAANGQQQAQPTIPLTPPMWLADP